MFSVMRTLNSFKQASKHILPNVMEEKTPPIKAKITIIRHGQTVYNAPKKRVQGQSMSADIVLSEQGKREIKALTPKKNPDLIICSPLLRVKQTAAAYLDAPDFDKIQCQSVLMDGLKEVDAGELVGCYVDDLPQKYKKVWHFWKKDPLHFTAFPKGESLTEFNARVLTAFSEICKRYGHTDKEILVFTHGGPTSILNCFLAKQDLSHVWDKDVPNLNQMTLTEEQILQLQNFKQPSQKLLTYVKQDETVQADKETKPTGTSEFNEEAASAVTTNNTL